MRKKVIPLTSYESANKEEEYSNRIPIERMRAIWNDKTETYTDEQLLRMRDWLYTVAEVVIQVVGQNKHHHSQTIALNHTPNEAEESHHLHPGQHRRAS